MPCFESSQLLTFQNTLSVSLNYSETTENFWNQPSTDENLVWGLVLSPLRAPSGGFPCLISPTLSSYPVHTAGSRGANDVIKPWCLPPALCPVTLSCLLPCHSLLPFLPLVPGTCESFCSH